MNDEFKLIATSFIAIIFIILLVLFVFQMNLYFDLLSLRKNQKIEWLNYFKDSNLFDKDFDWITNLYLATPAFYFFVEIESYNKSFHPLYLKRRSICKKFFYTFFILLLLGNVFDYFNLLL